MKVVAYISFFLIALFSGQQSIAQTQIERSVIGATGNEGSFSGININSTVGEIAVQSNATSSNIFTEGFQQPIRIIDEIVYDFTKEDASCLGQSNGFARIDNIEGCEGPYTVLWSNGKTGNLNFNLAPGQYSVIIQSNDGCVSNQFNFSIGTISNEPCILKFYSGITPNADGFNDAWIIDNIEAVPNNKVSIFNRNGNLVWQENNYDNINTVWAGENLSGNESPSDTYFFVFESSGFIEKGWIELTR